MTPAVKRFQQRYGPVYDAIASADLDQEDREALARDMAGRIAAGSVPGRGKAKPDPDFDRELFVLLASDPLVPCAGWDGDDGHHDCPEGTVIRLAWHWSGNPDGTGRSDAWKRRAPYGEIRCVSCGAMQFVPGYRENVLAEGAHS